MLIARAGARCHQASTRSPLCAMQPRATTNFGRRNDAAAALLHLEAVALAALLPAWSSAKLLGAAGRRPEAELLCWGCWAAAPAQCSSIRSLKQGIFTKPECCCLDALLVEGHSFYSHSHSLRMTTRPQAAVLGTACEHRLLRDRTAKGCVPARAGCGRRRQARHDAHSRANPSPDSTRRRLCGVCRAELLARPRSARKQAAAAGLLLFYFLLPCRRLHKSAQASETRPLRWSQGGVGGRSASSPPWCGTVPVTALNRCLVQSGGLWMVTSLLCVSRTHT